ncbi:DUF4349 domain-containing protein [Streptosporangium canum]|uniref:DUF4349 domain-containing protein n=1 Tax=Streptosporangium canum TaxID=324952 RepID=UPI0034211302
MSRFRYGRRLAVPLAGLALLVSACGGTGGFATSDSAPAPAADMRTKSQAGGADAGESAARPEKPRARTEQVKVVPQDRAIIYTAEMTVRAKDVTGAADRARQIVTAAGGHLAMEKSDAYSGGEGSAMLVFKIPPGGYPGVLERLGKELGTRESLQQNTEDVTEQVADVESRLRSAKSALDSLRALLKKADTIGEVLDVEREISGRESDLEALQARQKSLASQTSLATLTLNLVGPATVIPEEEDEPSGFLGGLRSGWEGFVTALKIGLTVLGVLLPWLIVIVPLWLLVAFLLRRSRRNGARRAPSQPLTAAPGGPAGSPGGQGSSWVFDGPERDQTPGRARPSEQGRAPEGPEPAQPSERDQTPDGPGQARPSEQGRAPEGPGPAQPSERDQTPDGPGRGTGPDPAEGP